MNEPIEKKGKAAPENSMEVSDPMMNITLDEIEESFHVSVAYLSKIPGWNRPARATHPTKPESVGNSKRGEKVCDE